MKLAEIGLEVSNGTLKNLGTISSFIGAKGKISMSVGNLANKETKVFFDLTDESGTKRRFFGSKAISKMVKNQEISKAGLLSLNIQSYELTEGERAGEIGYVVTAPQSEELVVSGSTKAEVAVGVKIADHAELAAW